MILPDWMSEERPVVTKVGRNNFLIRNRHHLEALLQKFETHPLKVASVFFKVLTKIECGRKATPAPKNKARIHKTVRFRLIPTETSKKKRSKTLAVGL